MKTYSILLEADAESGYTVSVPALPGCVTQGETVEECLAYAREAIELYLEVLRESGEAIPEQRARVQVREVTVDG